MKRLIFLFAIVTSIAIDGHADETALKTFDFEAGELGWKVWPMAASATLSLDDRVAKSGHRSLRLSHPDGSYIVLQPGVIAGLRNGREHSLTFWVRTTAPQGFFLRCYVRLNPLKDHGHAYYPCMPRRTEGEWTQRETRFYVPQDAESMTIQLALEDTVSDMWIDDIEIRPAEPEADPPSMYSYRPWNNGFNPEVQSCFLEHKKEGSPFYKSAIAYARALTQLAHVEEEARRVDRARFYLGKSKAGMAQETARGLGQELDSLYRTYGQIHSQNAPQRLVEEFDIPLQRFIKSAAEARCALASQIGALQQEAREHAGTWSCPTPELPSDVCLEPTGKPNQLLFGAWGFGNYMDMVEHVKFDFASTSGRVNSKEPGEFDVSPMVRFFADLEERGVKYTYSQFWLPVHDKIFCPEWLKKKQEADPDMLLVSWDGKRGADSQRQNYHHPVVREFVKEAATAVAKGLRGHREFMLYEYAQEATGPTFVTEDGPWRRVGDNPSSKVNFRTWLQRKYKTIAVLNERWKSDYASLDAIEPPDSPAKRLRLRATPLSSEFERWRRESYIDFLKLIYNAYKSADPDRPVANRLTCLSLSGGILTSGMPDTVDIMSVHGGRGSRFQMSLLSVYSLSRYTGKALGYFENHWGRYEDFDLFEEERAQRGALMKHHFRMTAWGRTIQTCWYSFWAVPAQITYNNNWFNPRYDALTMRYSAAGMPVMIEKLKRHSTRLLNSEIVPSRILILEPTTSILNNYPYKASVLSMQSWHRLLFPKNFLYESLPEEYILDGRASFDDFDVVILPYAQYFPDGLGARLDAWLREGGLLIADGPFGVYDELGFDDAKLLRAIWPQIALTDVAKEKPLWEWQISGTGRRLPRVVEGTLGKGKVLMNLQAMAHMREAQEFELARIAETVRRSAYSEPEGLELVLRREPDGKHFLCILNSDSQASYEGTVAVNGVFGDLVDTDIPGGMPVTCQVRDGWTEFRVRLAVAGSTFIDLGKEKNQ